MDAASLVAVVIVVFGEASGQAVVPFTPLSPAQKTVAATGGSGLAGGGLRPPRRRRMLRPRRRPQQKKQERLQKIQQLTFDRRPSAILKAWATPREVALEDDRKDAAGAAARVLVRRTGSSGGSARAE